MFLSLYFGSEHFVLVAFKTAIDVADWHGRGKLDRAGIESAKCEDVLKIFFVVHHIDAVKGVHLFGVLKVRDAGRFEVDACELGVAVIKHDLNTHLARHGCSSL